VKASSLLDRASELVLGSPNKSSIIEQCKALASLASLSFLRLVGFEKQNIFGKALGALAFLVQNLPPLKIQNLAL